MANGPRFSTSAALRNPSYFSNRARFSGDRTTAFNARTSSPATTGLGAGRTPGTRTAAFNGNRERVVARHSANWRPNWNRSRDHWSHGRRCHFHHNVWIIYEPLFWDPFLYGYGSYPYGSYYNGGYDEGRYDESGYYNNAPNDRYEPNEYSAPADTTQSQDETNSRVNEVQSALARAGYYDGPIDGRLGETTRKALRRYQRDRGLAVTGSINRAVIEALRLR